jgi:hypothetical protein
VVFKAVSSFPWPNPHDDLPSEGDTTDEPTPEGEALLQKRRELEERLDVLAAQYAGGELDTDPRRFNIAAKSLQAHISEQNRQLASQVQVRERPKTKPGIFWALTEGADEYRRRQLAGDLTPEEVQQAHDWAAAVVQRVIVKPTDPKDRGRRFNPDRVRIEWAPGP